MSEYPHIEQSLAEAAGMSLTYISNMEHGLKVPSLTTIIRLTVGLDCRATDLVAAFEGLAEVDG